MGSGLKEGGLQSRNAEGLYPRGRHWAQLVLLSGDLYLRFIPGALLQVIPLLQSVSEFLPNKDEFLKNYKCPCVTDMFSDLPCLLKNPNQINQITKTSKQTGQSVVKQIWFLWFWPGQTVEKESPVFSALSASQFTGKVTGEPGNTRNISAVSLATLQVPSRVLSH